MSILLDPLTPVTVPYDSLYYIGQDFQAIARKQRPWRLLWSIKAGGR